MLIYKPVSLLMAMLLLLPLSIGAGEPISKLNYRIEYAAKGKTQISIEGRVLDWETHKPLQGVSIQIIGFGRQTTSDYQGEFIFNDIPGGMVILQVSMNGYETLYISDIQKKPDSSAVLTILLIPCTQIIKGDVMVKGVRKKVIFRHPSGCRIDTLSIKKQSPKITVDYEPGVPIYNVIPVSEITVIMEDLALPQWPPVPHLIPLTGSSTTSDLSRESLAFDTTAYWWKRRVARVVDATLPIIDEIDQRRIAVELQGITATVKDQTLKK